MTLPSGVAVDGPAVAARGDTDGPGAGVTPPVAEGVAAARGDGAEAGGATEGEEAGRPRATSAATPIKTASAAAAPIAIHPRRPGASARITVGRITVSGCTRVAAGKYVAASGR